MRCPECSTEGWRVLPLTVGAHVKEGLWSKIKGDFYFCSLESCEVVYFNEQTVFRKGELKTRVGVKEREEPKPVCYCNRVTEKMLLEAAENFGKEKAVEITGAGKGKWCVVTNPSGRCCHWHLERLGFPVGCEKKAAKRVEIKLDGLTCMGCVSAVKAALEEAGANVVEIGLDRAVVEVDEEAELQKLVEAVEGAGYSARLEKR